MTDRPILFSAPMVRALLDGRKTMTRRLAWSYPNTSLISPLRGDRLTDDGRIMRPTIWQHVAPGDRLWVRERCVTVTGGSYRGVKYIADNSDVGFTGASEGGQWDAKPRPSIHMPRWASRLTLAVTAVKIERLQAITQDDAVAEGISWSDDYEGYHTEECRHYHGSVPERSFASLWRSLHGEESWAANPDVVAISFSVAARNIDAREAA